MRDGKISSLLLLLFLVLTLLPTTALAATYYLAPHQPVTMPTTAPHPRLRRNHLANISIHQNHSSPAIRRADDGPIRIRMGDGFATH